MPELVDVQPGTPDLQPLYALARRWERHSYTLPTGDRYQAGLQICAEQLRDIIAQMETDHA